MTVRAGAALWRNSRMVIKYPAIALFAVSLPWSAQSWAQVRGEITTYHDDFNNWKLGQISSVSVNGITTQQTLFDGLSRPTVEKIFGAVARSYTYSNDGTVATVSDGNGNLTALSNWKRGKPQSIKYPATPDSPSGATRVAVVDDSGWITSVTDENGYKTCYSYDLMGRISQATYPSETVTNTCATTTWATTTQVFKPVSATEYGIPAGHWRQTISTGNARKITYFDALWRPLVTREYDTANEAGTKRFQRFTYDHEGRVTFASYPGTTDALSTGTWTEYDALGRTTSVTQDSELGALTTLTAYSGDSTGPYTRTTDPRGTQTVTRYQMFDQPTYEFPVLIDLAQNKPERAAIDITRDVFGKPLSIRKRNNANTVSLTRSYTYNANQELCRSVEPETGATLMGYDGAGNLTWSASGLPAATACHATGLVSPIQARRSVRTYDGRNRVATIAFPDNNGNQSWTYTADGLPAQITTVNTEGGSQVVNAYTYNRRRLLVQETQNQPGELFSTLGYGYNANGHLASHAYPSGLTVAYAPNALGQPTQAGTYATAVTYYPNGAAKQFTYGNGIVHQLLQNARGLPSSSCDAYGACGAAAVLNDGYGYDRNGNVAAITDGRTGNRGNRTMTYDGLDRLTGTVSPMFGTATYAYDVLDNLTRVQVGATANLAARDHHYCYDSNTRRLSNVKTSGCSGATVIGLEYDVQGNLANRNGVGHTFDYGNRLRLVQQGSTWIESYRYDAHGRRARSWHSGGALRSVYGQDGALRFQRNDRTGKAVDYIQLNGSLVATREVPTAGGTATVKYQHTDALGSPVAVTDASRTVIERSEYEPYGRVGNRAARDGVGYTGHAEDAATGLTYMQQRYYDPQIGLFLSVDPVTAYSNPVGQFHRYRYTNNNPYRFTDPDGRAAVCNQSSCTIDCSSGFTCAVDYLYVGTVYGGRLLRNAIENIQRREEARPEQEAESQPQPGDAESDEGCIYCVDGANTESGKDYIGSSDDMSRRERDSSDGRDRKGAERVDSYKKGDRADRQNKEQQAMNDRGGKDNLDNKRNEVSPSKWEDRNIRPPSQ